MSDFFEEFRLNLKFYRDEKGWSQTDLAVQCDSSIGNIGNIESGKSRPSFDLLLRIANALEIHPADLFLRDASRIQAKDELSECYNIAHKLHSLPETPRKSIELMISDMSKNFSAE